jgi:hypothetical protein
VLTLGTGCFMNDLIRLSHRALRACAMLGVLLTAACSAWRPLPGAGRAHAESERLGRAKVFLRDGTELDLENATIGADSIIGFGGDTRVRLAVARSEVARVDAPQPDAMKTFLAGGLVTVSLAFLYVATILALLYGSND